MHRIKVIERIKTLRECLAIAQHDLLECTLADPLSLATHMAAITVAEIRRELDELEGGAVMEIAGMELAR